MRLKKKLSIRESTLKSSIDTHNGLQNGYNLLLNILKNFIGNTFAFRKIYNS